MANKRNPKFDEPIPYVVSELGKVWIEGQQRKCAMCGVVNFQKGYVYYDERYCQEHRPEHFTRDFREQSSKVVPEFDCYWMKWPTVVELDEGVLVLLCEI